ncbi:MAG: hypothetical protein JEY99_12990 [Spirochaetales bacterium]|nr:hypothetical protein [Spirochaetales bacterium]
MVFTIGNIITLVIVILILAIYRQLDRNNRSLEKIRRYSDKITEELDKFIDTKTVDVKNLAVELEVHQKTGREILKRISAAEVGLNERGEGIQKISHRIDGYDASINNLIALTGKVDESMKRLQEESEYVDKTGKRLKDVQLRIDSMEKAIPALTDKFNQVNSRELESLRGEVFREVAGQVEQLKDEISNSSDAIESFTYKIEQSQDEWVKQEEEIGNRLKRKFDDLKDESESRVESLESSLNSKLEDFKLRAGDVETAYKSALTAASERGMTLEDEVFTELKIYIKNQAAGLEKDMSTLLSQEEARNSHAIQDLNIAMEEARSSVTMWQNELGKRLEDQVDAFDLKFSNYSNEITEKLEHLDGTVGQTQAERRVELEELIVSTTKTLEELSIRSASEYNELAERTVSEMESIKSESSASTRDIEERVIGSLTVLEEQVAGYEDEINYRLSRIEEVGNEVKLIDDNLRASIADIISGVDTDFVAGKSEIMAHITSENDEVRKRTENMKESMGSLEKELDTLKSRAYDNVSEKLQVFEDDFFLNLKEREENIRTQFSEWQSGINTDLENMSDDAMNLRETMARELAEQLKERISQLQTKTFSQYEKYEEQVTNYQERINERIGLSERSMVGLEENIKNEIEDTRKNTRVEIDKVFTDHRTSIEALMNKWERDWELSLKDQEDRMEIEFRELNTGMESAKSEVTIWQTRNSQDMNEFEVQFSEKFANLKSEASETVNNINKDFADQRNDFDAFFLDLQKRSKDLEIEIDTRMKDFRNSAAEMKEKVESVQQRLFGKIEEESNSLNVSLLEIDKKMKNFISQTKVFDRADSMKMALQENIEDMKGELARITVQSREVKEAEKKFINIKKMNDEVSSKLARFLTEKRRIEEMEGDFKKLINLSQSIDLKLDQVTSSHDALQEVQIRIRNLEELENDVSQKYERLEKKRNLLDTTADNVDENFQKVRDLEDAMRSVEGELRGIAPQVAEITGQIKLIASERKRTAAAVSQLQDLDRVLTEVEGRMEHMQKAREWLAGTETRLEEINKRTEEQVQLLGTILKEDSRSAGKKAPMGSRDVVTKLARQGWSSEEIARATQLSRGEVELILELKK